MTPNQRLKSRVVAVVAARNEEERIGNTLDSILAQTHPPECIIVVNDGSIDDTALIAQSKGCHVVHTPPHKASYVGTPYLAAVWNAGLEVANHYSPDYIFISGADHVFPADYIERLLIHIHGTRIVVASGVIRGQPSSPRAPRGSGRLINAHYWRHISGMRYHVTHGWESYILHKARSMGLRLYVDDSLIGESRALSLNNHKVFGLGRAMRALGYWPPHAFTRSILYSFKKPHLGFFMLTGYLTYTGPQLDCAKHLSISQRTAFKERFTEALRRDRLRSPGSRGPLAYIRRKVRPAKPSPNRHISIFLTTRCNFNCFSCAALGMTPRPAPEDTTLAEIVAFLTHMGSIHPGSHIMLTGGEPTMYKELGKVCASIHRHGFKVSMLTNGYKMPPLEWFDHILLDYHGMNDFALDGWKSLMDLAGVEWDIRHKRYHQDIPYAMNGNITKGARCANWLEPLTLWRDVVYPCCNIMCVEWWNHTDKVTTALRESGWHVRNPDLPSTIENWRETLPAEVYRLCTLGCWKDSEKARWRRIK